MTRMPDQGMNAVDTMTPSKFALKTVSAMMYHYAMMVLGRDQNLFKSSIEDLAN